MSKARIGVGIIDYPYPVPRGKPKSIKGRLPHPDEPIHMHRKQNRPGLRESFSVMGDYIIDVECRTGGFHIWLTDDPDLVTCERCLKEME